MEQTIDKGAGQEGVKSDEVKTHDKEVDSKKKVKEKPKSVHGLPAMPDNNIGFKIGVLCITIAICVLGEVNGGSTSKFFKMMLQGSSTEVVQSNVFINWGQIQSDPELAAQKLVLLPTTVCKTAWQDLNGDGYGDQSFQYVEQLAKLDGKLINLQYIDKNQC